MNINFQVKILVAVMLVMLVFSCRKTVSINEKQWSETMTHLACYDDLRFTLISDSMLLQEVLDVRNSSSLGNKLPVGRNPEHGLISYEDLMRNDLINKTIYCEFDSQRKKWFDGLRMMDNQRIVIDVNRFEQNSFVTYFTTDRLIETHRLVSYFETENTGPLDDLKIIMYRSEKNVRILEVGDNWLYIVTHFISPI